MKISGKGALMGAASGFVIRGVTLAVFLEVPLDLPLLYLPSAAVGGLIGAIAGAAGDSKRGAMIGALLSFLFFFLFISACSSIMADLPGCTKKSLFTDPMILRTWVGLTLASASAGWLGGYYAPLQEASDR